MTDLLANMTVTVKIRNNYGTEAIYPVCDKAKTFAKMLNQKTFTRNDIDAIKLLGYTASALRADLYPMDDEDAE